MGLFSKIVSGLKKTTQSFTEKVSSVLSRKRRIDEDLYEELEEILIQADVGVETSFMLVEKLRKRVKAEKLSDASQLVAVLEEEINAILSRGDNEIVIDPDRLNILLVTGVNGAGKTTSIGKLAHYYREQGYRVLLAAADTFRAAAIEQLLSWGERAGVEVIHHQDGSDPGAVVFDACEAARSRTTNILIVDTAGRLQNKSNLMEELRKLGRIIERTAPDARVERLLVLDAGNGQNAISQAKIFGEVVDVSGIVLTKLDGTAKGGVVIGISNELDIPVKLIGVGEGIDDLRPFVPEEFSAALFAGFRTEEDATGEEGEENENAD